VTLRECEAGDVVALEADGCVRLFLVGALWGSRHKDPTKRIIRTVLLHAFDEERMQADQRCEAISMASPDAEVVEIVETAQQRLRRLRDDREAMLRRCGARGDSEWLGEVDPLRDQQQKAHVAARGNQADIPF